MITKIRPLLMCACGHYQAEHDAHGACSSRTAPNKRGPCGCTTFVSVPFCECGETRLDGPECPSCERPTDGTPTRECDTCEGYGIRRDDPRSSSYDCRDCRGRGWVHA
jgi:hypothetical protein